MSGQDITQPGTCKSRILAGQCTTCIFRPGNPMMLRTGGLAAIVSEAIRNGSFIVCHQTLTYGDNPDFGPAMCRGFWDRYQTTSIILIKRHKNECFVEPPEKEQESA